MLDVDYFERIYDVYVLVSWDYYLAVVCAQDSKPLANLAYCINDPIHSSEVSHAVDLVLCMIIFAVVDSLATRLWSS